MSFDVREITVNTAVGKIWNPTLDIEAFGDLIPRLFYRETMVIGASFVDTNGTAITSWVAGDTFELSVDVDFVHTIATGVLAQAYTGAVTSIEITFAEAPDVLGGTGDIVLRNDDFQRENVSYTSVSNVGLTYTFVVSKTLNFSYASGDVASVEDKLMVRVDDDGVDIVDDWADVDRANGEVSFRLDNSRFEFLRKLIVNGLNNDNELVVNFEIKRYPDGETVPTVLCQDIIYARNIVRDLEN